MKVRLLFFSIFIALCACSPKNQDSVSIPDIFIENGNLYDGIGSEPFLADIIICEDKITFIGDTSGIKAKRIIDATGLVVSPGFIDPHAHGNPLKSEFQNFISQGVTSITLGQDGASPFSNDFVEWQTKVDSAGSMVNIIPFLGHATVRNKVGVALDGTPSPKQLDEMNNILQKGFDEGVFGMTTGLEYIPGYYAREDELLSLAKTVGKNKGLIMSHMRNEDDDFVNASLRELIKQGQFSKVQASHLKVVYGKGMDRAIEILNILDSARAVGIEIYADTYPFTASYTGIGIVFPDWAKPPNDYEWVKENRRADLKNYLIERITYRNGPEATLFGTKPYTGKTLKFVADSISKHYADILIDDIGPVGASGAYFVMNEELQQTLFQEDNIMVCSDGSPTMFHPRGYATYSKVIEDYVIKNYLVSLPTAIHKMSGLVAKSIGIVDRGQLKEGLAADIIIFDPHNVKSNANFVTPHKLSQGIDYVIVNGNIAKELNDIKKEKFGKVLTK